jgi:hypothetical protein
MKKIWMIVVVLIYSVTVVAQKTKPIVITKPNTTFLKTLEQNAKSISPKALKGLTANEKSFLTLVKTATTAFGWDKAAYKTFAKNATPIIKSLGIMSDPDDGGEIFSDPDDGGEVFASSKLINKALNIVLNKVK